MANPWRHFTLVLISVLILLKLNWMHHIHAGKIEGPAGYYTNVLFGTVVVDTDGTNWAVLQPKCDSLDAEGFIGQSTGSCRAARWMYYIAYTCGVCLVVMTAMHATFISARSSKMVVCALAAVASLCIIVMMSVTGNSYRDLLGVESEPDAYVYGTVMILLFAAHATLYATADGGSYQSDGTSQFLSPG